MEFISYKGFKIEQISTRTFILWGKSLFNPIDIAYAGGESIEVCKKSARHYLKLFKVKEWPVLFTDRICKR